MRKCYKTLITYASEMQEERLSPLFDGLNQLFYNAENPESDPDSISFEKVLGFSDINLEQYFLDLYDERIIAFPYDKEDSASILNTHRKITNLVKMTFLANKNKYVAALKMYKAKYKPDVNNFVDEKESNGLKVDKSNSSSTPSGSMTTTSPYITSTDTVNKTTTYDNDTLRNQNSTTVNNTWANAGQSTTTFDNYKVESQTEATNSKESALGEDFNVGQNNQVSDRILHREGNIGQRSTQELWNQEIDLKGFNVIEEFYKDIKDKILLSVF